MAGKVLAHQFVFKSTVTPTGVGASTLSLWTDGTSFYFTDSSDVTTALGGGATQTHIAISDNYGSGGVPAYAFAVYEGANYYMRADTTDGAEFLTLGLTGMATQTTQVKGGAIDIASDTTASLTGVGNVEIDSSGGNTTIKGSSVYLGEPSSVDPVYMATSGTRNVYVGSVTAVETRLWGADSKVTLSSTGLALTVKDGAELTALTASGHTILSTDFASSNNITVGDVAAFADQDLILSVREVQVPGALAVTGASVFTGQATFDNDIVLNDGGSLKEGGGTAAFSFDGSGHVTKIGQSTSTTSHYLQWDGAKAVWAAGAGGGASQLSDLSDVGSTSGVADNNVLIYDQSAGEFEVSSVSAVLGHGSLNDLSDVAAPTPTDTQVLSWVNGTSKWQPVTLALGATTLNALTDVNAPSPANTQLLSWDNGTSKWIPANKYSNAEAVAAVEGEATLDLIGVVSTENGSGSVWAAVGGGSQAVFSDEYSTAAGGSEFFITALKSDVSLSPGSRYDICFSGYLDSKTGTIPSAWHPAVRFSDGSSNKVFFATRLGADNTMSGDEQLHFTVRLSVLVVDDPIDGGTKRYLIPAGTAGFVSSDPVSAVDSNTTVLGWNLGSNIPIALPSGSHNQNAVAMQTPDNTLVQVHCGFVLGTGGAHSGPNNVSLVITGAWINSFPGLAVAAGAGSAWPA